jgi:hypothetical protein
MSNKEKDWQEISLAEARPALRQLIRQLFLVDRQSGQPFQDDFSRDDFLTLCRVGQKAAENEAERDPSSEVAAYQKAISALETRNGDQGAVLGAFSFVLEDLGSVLGEEKGAVLAAYQRETEEKLQGLIARLGRTDDPREMTEITIAPIQSDQTYERSQELVRAEKARMNQAIGQFLASYGSWVMPEAAADLVDRGEKV